MGEGIGPAVASGLRVAQNIISGAEYSLAGIDELSVLLGPSTAG